MAGIIWTNDTRKLSDLVPWERNPVTLSKRAAEGLTVSIDKFGFAQPLLVGPDGSLYDGHQRQKILDMMDAYGPDAEVDVRVSSRPLTEAERQELAIRMRKNTGDFDFDILANEFEVDDLLEWGFEPFELGIDETPEAAGTDTEPQTNRAEELRELWGVEAGQLWRLPSAHGGEHRLICGDCTDADVVARVMGGEMAALCFTSPPYNQQLAAQSKPTGMHKENKWFHGLESAYFDSMPEDEYQTWQILVLNIAFELVEMGGAFFYNHKHRYRDRRPIIPLDWIRKSKWELRQEIIWDRRCGVAANAGMFIPGEERLYWLEKHGEHIWNGIGSNKTNVWPINPQVNDGSHVCPFPMELVEPPIMNVSNRQNIVYEPFAGSGTTIIACENLARQCRAVEISPAYCAVILQRYQDHTGITPELHDAD